MFEQNLIVAVKKNRCLYDKRFSDYKNIFKKAQVWENISANLKMPALTCKSRWKSLRDRFCRENWKKQLASHEEPNWQFYNSLKFLKDHLAPKRSFITNNSEEKNDFSTPFADELTMETNFKGEQDHEDVFGDIIEYTNVPVKPSLSESIESPAPSIYNDEKSIENNFKKRKLNHNDENFGAFFDKLDKMLDSKMIKSSSSSRNHHAFLELLASKLDKFSENDQEDIKLEILINVHEKYKKINNI